MAGDVTRARDSYRAAADRAPNLPQRRYLHGDDHDTPILTPAIPHWHIPAAGSARDGTLAVTSDVQTAAAGQFQQAYDDQVDCDDVARIAE